MRLKKEKYYLPSDYEENPALTFSRSPTEYWDQDRINTSHYYQYYVYELAAKLFSRKAWSTVLDIGAGPGTKLSKFFNLDKIDLTLLDQPGMEPLISKNCPKCTFHGTNLENGSFKIDKKFDLIICADVIEHLEQPSQLLKIIKNHLNTEGLVVLSTPERVILRGPLNRKSPNIAHVREWSSRELKEYLISEGFYVSKHYLMPQKKVSKRQLIKGKIMMPVRKNGKLHGCQTFVLKLRYIM